MDNDNYNDNSTIPPVPSFAPGSTIGPWRMIGRIRGMFHWILRKYQLTIDGDDSQTGELLRAVAGMVAAEDAGQCMLLADEFDFLMSKIDLRSISSAATREDLRKGAEEAAFIMPRWPLTYADAAMADHDFLADIAAEKKSQRRQLGVILGCVAAAIVILVVGLNIWNSRWQQERRLYASIENALEEGDNYTFTDEANRYLQEFPDGKHVQEVEMMMINYSLAEGNFIPIERIENYLAKYPGGIYANRCNEIYDSLWNVEIQKFDSYAASRPDSDGLRYLKGMLTYMKAHRVNVILTEVETDISVKEYSEYPASIRQFMEGLQAQGLVGDDKGRQPKLPDEVESIKESFSEYSVSSEVGNIDDDLTKIFDKILSPYFIRFETMDSYRKEEGRKRNAPVLKVVCKVTNQETSLLGHTVPELWIFHSSEIASVDDPCLVMGVDLAMTASLSYPGVAAPLQADVKEQMNEIQIYTSSSEDEASACYNKFNRQTVEKLGRELLNKLGLEK